MNLSQFRPQLHSSVTFPLHSTDAMRLWQGISGRQPARRNVPGIQSCLIKLKRIQHAAVHGDSNADAWLWWLEQKRLSAIAQITQLRQLTGERLQTLPDRLTTGHCHNPHPTIITLPQSLISPPGMRVIYLLLEFDLLAGEVIQTSQLALFTRRERNRLLWQGSHLVRSLLMLAQGFSFAAIAGKNNAHLVPPADNNNVSGSTDE